MTLTECRDFVIGRGWNYSGTCGCSTNMYKYKKPTQGSYEIRIGIRAEIYSIRQFERTIRQGNINEFETNYNQLFGES